jgi:alkaline phosphatase
MQVAEAHGKATGVITSVAWSHATPAGFVAHNVSRDNYAEIASEMIRDSATDVIMGCGNPWFDDSGQPVGSPNTYKYVGGVDTWKALVDGTAASDADGDGDLDPWTLIQTRKDFQELAHGSTPDRVCGVAQVSNTLQQSRAGDGYADPFVLPLTETVPTLTEMTAGALNVLDNDPDGFVLMIEGGAIDWAAHENQSGRMIEEEMDFNASAEAVVKWVEQNSSWQETLVIVTGDHETGYLTGPGSDPTWEPIANNGAGVLPGMEWHSDTHTNALIPLFANGVGSDLLSAYADRTDPVRGPYIDNTEIAQLILGFLKQRSAVGRGCSHTERAASAAVSAIACCPGTHLAPRMPPRCLSWCSLVRRKYSAACVNGRRGRIRLPPADGVCASNTFQHAQGETVL